MYIDIRFPAYHYAYALLAMFVPTVCSAQNGPLTAEFVKTGLFVISGGGCNSVLRLTQNGLILIDGKLPNNYDALLKKARKVAFSDQPVRALILTDHLERHTGNDAKFIAAGTRILAQENVKHNLESAERPGIPLTLPSITYRDTYDLKLGGVEAQLLHFGNAHTSGDTVVYFANLKVVAVGDLYSPFPDPDYSAGGSLVNWSLVLGEILKLDFDTVIPGTGPVVTRADLEALKNKLDIFVTRGAALVKSGVAKDQLMSRLKTEDLAWTPDFTGDRLDHLYRELAAVK